MGSVMAMVSPTRLSHAWHIPSETEETKTDPAQSEFSQKATDASAVRAPVVLSRFKLVRALSFELKS
jgi:hypothetical protein